MFVWCWCHAPCAHSTHCHSCCSHSSAVFRSLLLVLLAWLTTMGRIRGIRTVANALVTIVLHLTLTFGEAFLHPVSCASRSRSGAGAVVLHGALDGAASGNRAAPSLTKHVVPPVVRFSTRMINMGRCHEGARASVAARMIPVRKSRPSTHDLLWLQRSTIHVYR